MTCTSTPISPPSSEHRGDSGDSGGSEGGADGPLPNSPPLPISPLNSLGGTCMCAIHGRANAHSEKGVKEFPISSPESVFKRSKQTRFSLDRSQHGSHTVTDEKTGAGPSHGHTRRAKRGIRPFLGRSQLAACLHVAARTSVAARPICALGASAYTAWGRLNKHIRPYPSRLKTPGGAGTHATDTRNLARNPTQTTLRTVPSYRLTDAHAQRTTTQHAPRHDTTRHTMDMNLHQLHKSVRFLFS